MSHIEIAAPPIEGPEGVPLGLTPEELQDLYASIPVTLDCQRKCQAYCSTIVVSREEWDVICEYMGYEPPTGEHDGCPLLTPDGACGCHSVRPTICRLYGMTESMKCPWGCKPTPRYLTDAECYSYLLQAGTYGISFPKEVADDIAEQTVKSGQPGAPLRLLL